MTDGGHIVRTMTLEQKIAQLQGVSVFDLIDMTPPPDDAPPVARFDLARLESIRPDGVGHVSLSWLLDPDLTSFRTRLATLQEHARAVTPFGIGALVHGEGINGFLHAQGHQFPTAWAQASTWRPELIREVGRVVGDQMYEAGVHLAFAPVLDLARDPRWGRVHETYGEDPELAAQVGTAYIRGVQGTFASVLSTAKHFVGYGASEGGLNQARSPLGRREIEDVYVRPFARAIREAGLRLVMTSYNEVDGVPAAADRWLLTDLLRDTLGFDGLVVSDYDAISMLLKIYHTAIRPGQAAAQALSAGLDVELPGNETFAHLADEVRSGAVDEHVIDRAAARVLDIKKRMGLVPGSPPRPARGDAAGDAAALSRRVAEEAVVLLTNDGTLPLRALDRVAVLGTLADEIRIHFGAYTSAANEEQPLAITKILAGEVDGLDPESTIFTDLFQLRLPGIEPAFEARARELHPEAHTVLGALRALDETVRYVPVGSPALDAEPLDPRSVADEVTDADTLVVVVGERTGWVGNHTAGEGRTTSALTLPGNQRDLIRAAVATGKPVVVVLISGRPLLLEADLAGVRAAVLAPLLGPVAGDTIAEVLVGDVNPGGKLVSTFPRSLGQLPMHHGHRFGSGYAHPTGTRHGYVDLDDQTPLFAFGHGGSYTTFDVALHECRVTTEDEPVVELVCEVSNTGDRAGSTVVQVYARDEDGTVVRPVRQLLTFGRYELAGGQSERAVLRAPLSRLDYTLPDGRRGIEAGPVTFLVGLSSDELTDSTTIDVAGTIPDAAA